MSRNINIFIIAPSAVGGGAETHLHVPKNFLKQLRKFKKDMGEDVQVYSLDEIKEVLKDVLTNNE